MKTFRTAYDRSRDKKGKWLDFSEEQFVLCSPRVLGYSLDKKIWIQMLLKNMDTVSQSSDRNAFEDLVLPDDSLPENTKFLIESLVSHHITAKARKSRGQTGGLEDFVEGKGQGLVILLHGKYVLFDNKKVSLIVFRGVGNWENANRWSVFPSHWSQCLLTNFNKSASPNSLENLS